MLSGGVPCAVQPLLYGANLVALRKPDGGMRPIAVGNTLRRLVVQVISMRLCAVVGDHLRPIQLGYGTPGGCEAAIHAARTFLGNSSPLSPRVLLKIDYKNAFNTIRRDTFLGIVRDQFPEVYPFVWQCYNSPSTLFFGDSMLKSATGVQQGDPLGPGLFSLAIHALLNSLKSCFNVWYLADGSIGGKASEVAEDLKSIIEVAPLLGLELNLSNVKSFLAKWMW